METTDRYLRFWLIGDYKTNQLTAIRGQYGTSGDDDLLLFDIVPRDGKWRVDLWIHLETDPDALAKRTIGIEDDCFRAMVTAENYAAFCIKYEIENEE